MSLKAKHNRSYLPRWSYMTYYFRWESLGLKSDILDNSANTSELMKWTCDIRERITLAYFTTKSFFTDMTPLTLRAISPALSTAF